MVLCVIALPLFAFLGIFSVKYRALTKEALGCLFRTVTLRRCQSGLDQRLRANLTGKVMRLSPKAAGIVHRHYQLISWLFLALMLWSLYVSALGLYNFQRYGNCNGPADTSFCPLDPTGQNSKVSEIDAYIPEIIIAPVLEADDPIIGNPNAELTIIEFGCYACPYTKRAEPTVAAVLDHYGGRVNVQFKSFLIPHHRLSYEAALAAECAQEQGRYLDFHRLVFQTQDDLTSELLPVLAQEIGLNMTVFNTCYAQEKYQDEIEADSLMGIRAGVYGTPTFFINNKTIVGPKPERTFLTILDEELGT